VTASGAKPRSPHPLIQPKWLVAHVSVASIVVAFVLLGLWQVERHFERQEENRIGAERMAAGPVPLEEVLSAAQGNFGEIRYRMVTVSGEYDTSREVLIRSQTHLGSAGFHVVTPLVLPDGRAVLINRGWVPLQLDTPPVAEAAPGEGSVTVTGWVETSQSRPAFGPEDPPGGLLRVNRVDVPRIGQQLQYDLLPVYLVAEGPGERLPEPVRRPSFEDAGPHLGYAIQWFGFATVGLVGYVFLARRRVAQSSTGRARSSTTS
jgi:surfeit locus 1 family protein